jgi:HEPN domain-containing protein
MSGLTEEWIRKAEGDAGTARREACVPDGANWDAVCFHAQQAVEKYLKALLQQLEIPFPKTHDLAVLLNLALSQVPDLEALIPDIEWVSSFAVEFRYPGEDATQEDAEMALQIMEKTLGALKGKMPPR